MYLCFTWQVLGIRLNHEEGTCQFLVFLTYACSFLSVWYTVCITVENYIAICHPSRVRTLCTRKRATVVVCVLTVTTLPLYILSAAATGNSLPPRHSASCRLLPQVVHYHPVILHPACCCHR